MVWARALGFPQDESGGQRVSRNWRVLRELNLVTTVKAGRQVNATLLREDGTGGYPHSLCVGICRDDLRRVARYLEPSGWSQMRRYSRDRAETDPNLVVPEALDQEGGAFIEVPFALSVSRGFPRVLGRGCRWRSSAAHIDPGGWLMAPPSRPRTASGISPCRTTQVQ